MICGWVKQYNYRLYFKFGHGSLLLIMDLLNIINIHSLIVKDTDKPKLTQKQLKALKWKPTLVPKDTQPKLGSTEYLKKNLRGFMRFMVEYPDMQ